MIQTLPPAKWSEDGELAVCCVECFFVRCDEMSRQQQQQKRDAKSEIKRDFYRDVGLLISSRSYCVVIIYTHTHTHTTLPVIVFYVFVRCCLLFIKLKAFGRLNCWRKGEASAHDLIV
jgi:hypothetical protein